MKDKTMLITIVITSILIGFQSPGFAKGKKKDLACTTPGGGNTTCVALQNCLLDGGYPTSDSGGGALCCPHDPDTTPNQTCTMIKVGNEHRGSFVAPTAGTVIATPSKPLPTTGIRQLAPMPTIPLVAPLNKTAKHPIVIHKVRTLVKKGATRKSKISPRLAAHKKIAPSKKYKDKKKNHGMPKSGDITLKRGVVETTAKKISGSVGKGGKANKGGNAETTWKVEKGEK